MLSRWSAAEDYGIEKINDLWRTTDPVRRANLDLLLTLATLSYYHDSSFGRIQPRLENPELFSEAGKGNLTPQQILQEMTRTTSVTDVLDSLSPQHHYYQFLKQGLAKYRAIKAAGGWPVVPVGRTLRPGDHDESIIFVKKRLLTEGDYREQNGEDGDDVYTSELADAVRLFQRQHGLEGDAIIGPATYKRLQETVDDTIANIIINLARWRWMDHDLGAKYVMVNIADFNLVGVKENKTALQLNVVVGANRHQTPAFSGLIQYVELNPYWTVPVSIATNEELPALRKNSYHLKDRNVRLFSGWQDDAPEIDSTTIDWHRVSGRQMRNYRLRQDPGPGNALGYIKIVFPNKYSVYLHDTPSRNLFSQHKRNFSHGCIRVSTPEKLAGFLLEGTQNQWDEAKIIKEISLGKNKVLSLPVKIPVHLTYQTAWSDSSNIVHFNTDIYDRDTELLKALEKKK